MVANKLRNVLSVGETFFRNIGLADELGSGVRNLYYYGRRYSGKDPELIEGDVFRIIVPLDDNYSFDADTDKVQIKRKDKAQIKRKDKAQIKRKDKAQIKRKDKAQIKRNDSALIKNLVLEYLSGHPHATQVETAEAIGKSRRGIQNAIASLKQEKLLAHEGARKNGRWVIISPDSTNHNGKEG